jgi:hypothetical protein
MRDMRLNKQRWVVEWIDREGMGDGLRGRWGWTDREEDGDG